MRAVVKSGVGWPWGTREELRARRCPLPSKKCRNVSRISFPVQDLVCVCVPPTLPSSCSRLSQTRQASANVGRERRAIARKSVAPHPLPPLFVTAPSTSLHPRRPGRSKSKRVFSTKLVQDFNKLGTPHFQPHRRNE